MTPYCDLNQIHLLVDRHAIWQQLLNMQDTCLDHKPFPSFAYYVDNQGEYCPITGDKWSDFSITSNERPYHPFDPSDRSVSGVIVHSEELYEFRKNPNSAISQRLIECLHVSIGKAATEKFLDGVSHRQTICSDKHKPYLNSALYSEFND